MADKYKNSGNEVEEDDFGVESTGSSNKTSIPKRFSAKNRDNSYKNSYSGSGKSSAYYKSSKNSSSGSNSDDIDDYFSDTPSNSETADAFKERRHRKNKQKRKEQKLIEEQSYENMKHSRFSRRGTAAFIVFLVLIVAGVAIFSAFLSYTYLVDKYENPVSADSIEISEYERVKFRIEKGAKTATIAESLKEQGLIKNTFLFKLLSKFNGYDSEYKSGIHYLCEGLSYDEIMVILSSDPVTVKVTFPEGFTTIQIAERLEANGVCGKEEFLAACNSLDLSSYSFVPELDETEDYRLDGFLFPDTYTFEIDSTPDQVIYKMLNRFNDIFLPEWYSRVEKLGLTVKEVVTIASYVERECKISSEAETIARVYYNRLISEDFELMQCDATVMYIIKRNTGSYPEALTKEDLEIDDPYNTYVYGGLTPGPICNPSSKSIQAVIQMNEHNYYYYVLKNDGTNTHAFATTYEEHLANIAEYRN